MSDDYLIGARVPVATAQAFMALVGREDRTVSAEMRRMIRRRLAGLDEAAATLARLVDAWQYANTDGWQAEASAALTAYRKATHG